MPKELFIFKFRVLYSDASEDYITLDDINGIDMILLDWNYAFAYIELISCRICAFEVEF